MERLLLIRREREVASDHDALGDRGIAAEAELGRDGALVHVTSARQRRILAVERDRATRRRVVLERTTHERRRDDGLPVVGEPGGAPFGELDHLGELASVLALRDRRQEADRDLRLRLRALDQVAEERSGVDHGIGVRHPEDRAVPAGRGGPRARAEVLLVLAARGPEMDVWVDERRREHESVRLDHPVGVGVEALAERGDHAAVHADVERRVDSLTRVENPGAADDQIGLRTRRSEQDGHHATSSIARTATSTGSWVRRS